MSEFSFDAINRKATAHAALRAVAQQVMGDAVELSARICAHLDLGTPRAEIREKYRPEAAALLQRAEALTAACTAAGLTDPLVCYDPQRAAQHLCDNLADTGENAGGSPIHFSHLTNKWTVENRDELDASIRKASDLDVRQHCPDEPAR